MPFSPVLPPTYRYAVQSLPRAAVPGIHQMTKVELALAAVLGTALICSLPRSSSRRILLFAGVAVRCACSSEWSHGRCVPSRVYACNIRSVRVAFLKRDADFLPASSGRCRPYVSPVYGRDWVPTGFHNPVSTYRGQSRG